MNITDKAAQNCAAFFVRHCEEGRAWRGNLFTFPRPGDHCALKRARDDGSEKHGDLQNSGKNFPKLVL